MSVLYELKLNPSNPRTITAEQFDRLKKSLTSFTKMLELRPICYDDDFIVWGGNMRTNALRALVDSGTIQAKEEYFKKIPSEWSTDDKRQFAIRDNVELGEWSDDVLANEWSDLPLEEWGVDTAGWQSDEVQEDEPPEVSTEPAVSKLGEVYQLGRHRLMAGDSTKIEDVEKLMNGQKADMVFTDPPYGIDLDTDYSGMPSRWNNKEMYQGKYKKVIGDNKPFDASYLIPMAKEVFLFGADYYANTLPDSGVNGTWYCWDKREDDDGGSFDKMLGSPFELCWGKKKRGKKFIRMRWASFLHSDATQGEKSSGRIHPTQKPVALCGWFIEKASKKEDIIIDLFGGSGSTLIACEQLNRTCYMMELDNRYTDVIIKRWQTFTGQEAVRLSDGRKWNELSQETQMEHRTESTTIDTTANIEIE